MQGSINFYSYNTHATSLIPNPKPTPPPLQALRNTGGAHLRHLSNRTYLKRLDLQGILKLLFYIRLKSH